MSAVRARQHPPCVKEARRGPGFFSACSASSQGVQGQSWREVVFFLARLVWVSIMRTSFSADAASSEAVVGLEGRSEGFAGAFGVFDDSGAAVKKVSAGA